MTLDERICGMKMYKLGDLCSDVVDCPHSTPEWKNEGIRVIRNFNIVNGSLDFSNGFFVDEETFEKRTQRACPEFEDLVISREAPMGAVCMIPKNLKCCLGQRLVLLKINKELADPNYILFAIQSQFVQKQIQIIDQTGSIVSNLNIPDLKSLRIPLPSLPDQKKIACVLSSLDDKIALNKKMNQKLEAMAKRLYDYWFVQFDFPDKNGRPYKTTGGPMTYNPTLKREIPVGWVVRKLEDVLSKLSSGKRPKGGIDKSLKDGIPSLGAECIDDLGVFDFKKTPYLPHDFKSQVTTGIIEDKDIAVYKDGAYVGKTTMFQDDFPFKFSTVNEHVFLLHCQDESFEEYLLFVLKQLEYFSIMQNLGKAKAAQPGLNQEDLMNILILWPSNSVMNAFSKSVKTLFSQLFSNAKENKKLTALRDKLLPLLMNGQVVVG